MTKIIFFTLLIIFDAIFKHYYHHYDHRGNWKVRNNSVSRHFLFVFTTEILWWCPLRVINGDMTFFCGHHMNEIASISSLMSCQQAKISFVYFPQKAHYFFWRSDLLLLFSRLARPKWRRHKKTSNINLFFSFTVFAGEYVWTTMWS